VVAGAQSLQNGANAITSSYAAKYNVTSSAGATGSAGSGWLNQSYIDALTGIKFTIMDPQTASPAYRFVPGDILTFVVNPNGAFVTGSAQIINILGLNTKVVTTLNISVNDTAIIQTFNKAGNEPSVGDYYDVSYTVAKRDSDLALRIFTNAADAYNVYGTPDTTNRLSLAVKLLTENGGQAFGCIQVRKQPGQDLAADIDFQNAIDTLKVKLPGSINKANVIVPITSSSTVQQYLGRHLITQASIRNKGEAMGFVGFDRYSTTATARATARSLHNSRIVAVAPFVFGVNVQLANGSTQEFAVDGPFVAAALAGLNVNPANDPATTLTLQNVVGFTRILKSYDDSNMDLMAADGLCVLENNNGALQVRHYKTTDPSNDLTSEPTSVTSVDFTRQQMRTSLQQYIGRKFISSLINDVQVSANAVLKGLSTPGSGQILSGYKNLVVSQSAESPTLLNITASIKPMFSLLYIDFVFTLTTSL
jgi:hypothetical protein